MIPMEGLETQQQHEEQLNRNLAMHKEVITRISFFKKIALLFQCSIRYYKWISILELGR